MILSNAFMIAVLSATSALAHSHMFQPTPRQRRDYAYTSSNQNSCEGENTNIPNENVFQRGQQVPTKWWWNNHDGGFIRFSLIKANKGFIGREDQAFFNRNENIIQAQCYTRQCDRNGFDPGNTKECVGHPIEIPNWVADGEYILQWSQIGGFNSEAVATRQLPIYHNCANVRIQGGTPVQDRPGNWIAPFFGGDMVKVNGEDAGPNRCAFKRFAREPEDPSVVDTKNDDPSLIKLGVPEGWAAQGSTVQKRNDVVRLPRLGHVARNVALDDLE